MKKHVLSAATVLAATVLLAGCSGAGSEAPPSGEESPATEGEVAAPEALINEGELTVCIDPEYPPLEYYADGSGGEIIGFDADAVRALAGYWGVEPNFAVTSFDGLMPGLQSGRCDLIFGGLYTSEERLEVADAAPVMVAMPSLLMAPALESKISEAADLCGLTVAAQSASSNAAQVNAIAEECEASGEETLTVTEYPKTSDTVLAVLNGKADALVETNVAASYMVSQNKGKLVQVDTVFPADTVFGVFSEKDGELTEPIADAIVALHDDGTLAEIATKYELDPTIVDVE